ncbi:MAG: hydrolase [Gemmatimonadetes bacterium]|nr:hydrolase [Gemmatimonadota bacterium]
MVRSLPLFALLALARPLAAQVDAAAPRPVARAVRTRSAPVIDGRLDDSVWAAAAPLDRFIQHEPFDGREATERTEVRILFDEHALYIGARLFDREPAGIIRGETRRDLDLKEQDAFILLFDTFRDRQNAFLFGTTPAGVEHDGQINKEGEGGFGGPVGTQPSVTGANENVNWDGTWQVKTTVDEQGWVAEFRIPFETLRYGGGRSQVWGLNVARYIRRKNEEDFWSPVPRQHTLYRISMAGSLEGLEPPSRRVALLTPYALGSVHRDDRLGTGTDLDAAFGADAKIGLTQSLTMDLTYHTDFAQVEADEQQINLTRFNLFFPEKRPFFLENAGIFAFGTPQSVDLFFSRRIGIAGNRQVPILGGGRVSGKVGPLAVGLLDVQTEGDAPNNFAVGRVLYELPHRSRIGAIAVSRLDTDSTGDHNVTVGVDGKLGIGQAVSLDGYLARSSSPGRSGRAFNLSGTYTTRQWELGSAVRQVGDGFSPDVGFLERPTFTFYSFRILRHLRTPGIPWFRETRPHITFRQYDDLDGRPQSRLIHIDSHFLFANGSFFELPGSNLTREAIRDTFEIAKGIKIPPGVYDHFEWSTAYNTNLSAPYSVSGTITIGGFYTGRHHGGTLAFTARPNDRFNASLRLNHDNIDLAEGSFNRTLVGVRMAYAFTPKMFVQTLTQYNDQTETFSANVRFGWLGPAGTGLFVVYNEGRATGEGGGLADRAFLVKFTRQLELAR